MKHKKDMTADQFNEWMLAYAKAEMAKAGPCEDLQHKGEHIVGFPRTHVSVYLYKCIRINDRTRPFFSFVSQHDIRAGQWLQVHAI